MRKLLVVLAFVIVVHFGVLIGYTVRALDFWIEDAINYGTYEATCSANEFVDNIAIELGFEYYQAKEIQALYIDLNCG